MNCLDFRRTILANPRQPGEAQLGHAGECAACREFLEKQRELDADLYAALQVPPPDGLAERILVTRGMKRPRWAMPIAAALVLALGVGMLWPRVNPVDPLGREAIAHLDHEPEAFTTAHAIAADFLPAMLSNQGVKLVGAVGQVTYARLCPMAGRVAHHLVLQTAGGPVTLFLFAEDPTQRERRVTQSDGMTALVVPAAKGSITIVAPTLDQAMAIEKSLQVA